jgi:hypothetical protein
MVETPVFGPADVDAGVEERVVVPDAAPPEPDAAPPELLARLNIGGPEVTVDDESWIASYTHCGGTNFSVDEEIHGTDLDAIYQTQRYGSRLDCTLGDGLLVDGRYSLRFHFAELYFGPGCTLSYSGAGDRVFDIYVEDELTLPDNDIFLEGGGCAASDDPLLLGRPIQKDVVVAIDDGAINVHFEAKAFYAMVSGIEVYRLP